MSTEEKARPPFTEIDLGFLKELRKSVSACLFQQAEGGWHGGRSRFQSAGSHD
jgi:hypothetical protein